MKLSKIEKRGREVLYEFDTRPELKTCPRCGGAARYGRIEPDAVICADCGKVGENAAQWNDPKWRGQFRYEVQMLENAAMAAMLEKAEL